MEASDLKRLKEMDAELSRLKRMYAYLGLENHALKERAPMTLGDLTPADYMTRYTRGLST